MDSTLIQCEVVDELAKIVGVGKQVIAITEQTMQGKLDFDQSLKQRVKLLKGLPEQTLQKVADNLPLTSGVKELVNKLHQHSYTTAILSGGFTFFAKHLQKQLGFNYTYSNHLEIKNGVLTGNVIGDIVNADYKAAKLREIAYTNNIPMEKTLAIGDGANDLPMLKAAGLGIAFHAKPVVSQSVHYCINHGGLDRLLHALTK